MQYQKKEKNFIRLPLYPGGKEALLKFVEENVVYPKQAREQAITGLVHVAYEVNDEGDVVNAKVTKGLGYGCDEESLRVVHLLKYGKTKNRGYRVKSSLSIRISFKPPVDGLQIVYEYTGKKTDRQNNSQNDHYTITF